MNKLILFLIMLLCMCSISVNAGAPYSSSYNITSIPSVNLALALNGTSQWSDCGYSVWTSIDTVPSTTLGDYLLVDTFTGDTTDIAGHKGDSGDTWVEGDGANNNNITDGEMRYGAGADSAYVPISIGNVTSSTYGIAFCSIDPENKASGSVSDWGMYGHEMGSGFNDVYNSFNCVGNTTFAQCYDGSFHPISGGTATSGTWFVAHVSETADTISYCLYDAGGDCSDFSNKPDTPLVCQSAIGFRNVKTTQILELTVWDTVEGGTGIDSLYIWDGYNIPQQATTEQYELQYNTCSDIRVVDSNNVTIPYEVEELGTGYQTTSAYSDDAELVYHFGDMSSIDYTFSSAIPSVPGKIGSAYDFNDDDLRITPINLHADTPWAISHWLYLDAGQNAMVLGEYSTSANYIYMKADGNLQVRDSNNNAYTGAIYTQASGSWIHYTWYWNTTYLLIYENAILLNAESGTFDGNFDLDSLGNPHSAVAGFNGKLDDIRVYNDIYLTQTQITALAAGTQYEDIAPDNLLLHVTGEVGRDSSSGGSNATMTGVDFIANGVIGGAVDLENSEDDLIDFGIGASTLGTDFTLCADIKIASTDVQGIIYIRDESSPYYQVGLMTWGTTIEANFGGNNYGANKAEAPMKVGEWANYCMVRNGTGSEGSIYLNGTLIEIHAQDAGANYDTTNFKTRYGTNTARDYDGSLDNVKIWNRALTQTEISAIYNNSQNANMLLEPIGGESDINGPVPSNYNITSGNNYGENTQIWNLSGMANVSSNLLSYTHSLDEAGNCSARVNVMGNYTENVAANENYKYATTETVSQSYTLYDDLAYGKNYICISCIDASGNEPITGNCSAIVNVTLYSAPNITLYEPEEDSSKYYGNSVDFNYSLYDEDDISAECSLVINGTLNQTQTTNNNTLDNFTVLDFIIGSYEWYINCTDSKAMTNSETRNLSIISNPPTWDYNISNTTIVEDSGTTTYLTNLSDYVTDLDGDTIYFSVQDENTSEVDCEIFNNYSINITPADNYYGNASCTIGINDSTSFGENRTFWIEVTQINDDINASPIIYPLVSYTNDTLTCNWTLTGETTGVDESYYRWYNDTGIVDSGRYDNITFPTLSSSNFIHFDNITCSVLPNNGEYNSSYGWFNSTALEISNFIPVLNLSLTNITTIEDTNYSARMTNYTFDIDVEDSHSYTCTPSNTSEVDCDTENNSYNFMDNQDGFYYKDSSPDANFVVGHNVTEGYDSNYSTYSELVSNVSTAWYFFRKYVSADYDTITFKAGDGIITTEEVPALCRNDTSQYNLYIYNSFVGVLSNQYYTLIACQKVSGEGGEHIFYETVDTSDTDETKIYSIELLKTSQINVYPAQDWYGNSTIDIVATDGYNVSEVDTVNVEVISINDAPYNNATIPNITISFDGYNDSINLFNYFKDAENTIEGFNYTCDQPYIVVDIDNTTGIANISGNEAFYGEVLCNFAAYDGEYWSDTSNDSLVNITYEPWKDLSGQAYTYYLTIYADNVTVANGSYGVHVLNPSSGIWVIGKNGTTFNESKSAVLSATFYDDYTNATTKLNNTEAIIPSSTVDYNKYALSMHLSGYYASTAAAEFFATWNFTGEQEEFLIEELAYMTSSRNGNGDTIIANCADYIDGVQMNYATASSTGTATCSYNNHVDFDLQYLTGNTIKERGYWGGGNAWSVPSSMSYYGIYLYISNMSINRTPKDSATSMTALDLGEERLLGDAFGEINITINPTTAYELDDLTCNYTVEKVYTDVYYKWYVNDVLQPNISSVWYSGEFSTHDNITCGLIAVNEYTGTYSDEAFGNITVLNHEPDITLVYPENNAYNILFNTTLNVTIIDNDLHTVNVSYYFDNGTLIGEDNDVTNGSMLYVDILNRAEDEVVTWFVAADDGYNITYAGNWTFNVTNLQPAKLIQINDTGSINHTSFNGQVCGWYNNSGGTVTGHTLCGPTQNYTPEISFTLDHPSLCRFNSVATNYTDMNSSMDCGNSSYKYVQECNYYKNLSNGVTQMYLACLTEAGTYQDYVTSDPAYTFNISITDVYNLTAYITPTSPFTHDNLIGKCQGLTHTAGNITYHFQWFKDSVLYHSGYNSTEVETGILSVVDTMPYSNTTIGDDWKFSCIGQSKGDNSNSTIVYSNEVSIYNISIELEGYTRNITAEIGSNINVTAKITNGEVVCIDVVHPEYGSSYTCNQSEVNFTLNPTFYTHNTWINGTQVNLTGNGSISYYLDNRTVLSYAALNLTAGVGVSDLTYFYQDGTNYTFVGTLSGNTINSSLFTVDGVENTTATIFYDTAGEEGWTITFPENPKSYSFYLYGNDLDVGNDLEFKETFINDTNLTSPNTNGTLWLIIDDFMQEGQTTFVDSSTGSGYSYSSTSELDTANKRYKISASAYAVTLSGTCTASDGCAVSSSSTQKFSTTLYNIEQYKKIKLYASISTGASCTHTSSLYGVGSASSAGYLILSNDDTLVSYETVPGASSSSNDACLSSSSSDSDSSSGWFTLVRNEDYGSSLYSFKVYKNDVLQGTTTAMSSGIDIGGYSVASAHARCTKNYYCPAPSGSGSSTVYMYNVNLSGAGTQYILNNTYNSTASYTSDLIFTAPTDIKATTLTAREYLDSGCSIDYKISNDNGSTWETVLSGTRHIFGSTGNELRWNATMDCGSNNTKASVIEVDLDIIPGTLENLTIDFNGNGTTDYSYMNKLNSTNSPQIVTFDEDILSSLDTSSGSQLAISMYSVTPGIVLINNSIVSSDINPISMNTSKLEDCNDCELDWTYSGAELNFTDLDIRYLGGNKTYTITAHNNNSGKSLGFDVQYFYSKWTDSLAPHLDYIDFYPSSVSSQNVQPFGQTTTQPILTVEPYNYLSRPFNYSGYLNGSKGCVDLTLSTTNSKSAGNILQNVSWVELFNNATAENNVSVWMWADLSCTIGEWYQWAPDWHFKACAKNVDICKDGVFD